MDPAKFDRICEEINEKKEINDNDQTKVSFDPFQRY